ncbi:NAD(P)/FAD-dependent oxidoreductase [Aureimonas mangrovi]|uniref:NAD(P)/FAD-dependent oxidoreductase n=1 Tax=Aureimonas mangrovi TaxID=2758041 RepID=UPI00163D4CC5|nr:NAD(P)/FAD-dependent oxidoreductase [Aureimonas mangrovi]
MHDAIIVGGGFAGLAAATYLGRARADVLVFDTGAPRNRFAQTSHGFLGHDGKPPLAILAAAREQLASYPTVALSTSNAIEAGTTEGGFFVRAADGTEATARRLILAFGLNDTLPQVPGLAERWGRSVIHCPYCHGFEFSDRELGVLYSAPGSLHQARIVREWGPVTLFLNGHPIDDAERAALAALGIAIEPEPVVALGGADRSLEAVRLEGRTVPIDALYVAPRSTLSSPLAAQLGCIVDEGPMGPVIRTDADRMTTVSGVFAAGDIARAPHSVSWAVADGVTAGTAAHRSLVFG